MAQDATGTPTALGIPKYNTAADSPSGKGFNAAMDAIDAIIQAQIASAMGQVPAGTVAFTAASAAPTGWLLCDGAAVSRTTYATLFAAIGTQYGAGDGSTTFNVPNMKGRVPVGLDSADSQFDTRGETGGVKTVTLTALQSGVRAHSHGVTDPGHQHEFGPHSLSPDGPENFFAAGAGSNIKRWQNEEVAPSTTGISIQNATAVDAQDAHDNLQPYIVLHGMVKT